MVNQVENQQFHVNKKYVYINIYKENIHIYIYVSKKHYIYICIQQHQIQYVYTHIYDVCIYCIAPTQPFNHFGIISSKHHRAATLEARRLLHPEAAGIAGEVPEASWLK